VGREEPRDVGLLERSGLRIARAPSVVRALELLSSRPATVGIVHGEALGDREAERWAALRRAGVAALVGVYPPDLAWRAERASAAGADFGVALPAAPGALADLSLRLVQFAPQDRDAGAVAGIAPPPDARDESYDEAVPETAPAAPPSSTASTASVVRPMQSETAESSSSPPPVAAAAAPAQPAWVQHVLSDAASMARVLQDLDRLLDVAMADLQRASGARRTTIALFDPDRRTLTVRRTTVAPPDDAPKEVPPDGLAAHVARTGRAAFVADVTAPPEDLAGVKFGTEERGYAARSCAVVPLVGADDVVGVACFSDREGGAPFRPEDAPALAALAEQAGLALGNAFELRRLRELASIDELTGLANRRQFGVAIELEVQRARRYDRPMSLVLLDLDHFKTYNDTCGHQAGDRALAKVGELLRTTFREVDVVARYGGEEFAVILPETSARSAQSPPNPFPSLERLRKRIEETEFPGAEKLPGGKLTISGGVACFPDDAGTVEDLIREADRSLYASKAKGRNTITYRGQPV
jgi:diguanylate cyclase (GGDEF)-like protein